MRGRQKPNQKQMACLAKKEKQKAVGVRPSRTAARGSVRHGPRPPVCGALATKDVTREEASNKRPGAGGDGRNARSARAMRVCWDLAAMRVCLTTALALGARGRRQELARQSCPAGRGGRPLRRSPASRRFIRLSGDGKSA